VSGSTSANSSPPNRATMSVARVVQLRQVVGHRQRLGALHAQRVVERDRAGLERRQHRRQRRRAEARLAARRRAVDRHQRPHDPAAAPQGKRQRRRGRLDRRPRQAAVDPQIGRPERLARPDHPAADRVRRRLERRRQPPRGHRPQVPRLVVGGHHQPARDRDPVGRLGDHGLGDTLRVQAAVDRPDHLGEGVRTRQAAPQRRLVRPQPPGEIRAHRRRQSFPARWTTGASLPTCQGQSALGPI
jgi:hypothetical protein